SRKHSKTKPNGELSFQRLPEEQPLTRESPSSISATDNKINLKSGSKQEPPSVELMGKTEASKTGEVTETEQRLDRIKTYK
ncbi:hypothetical protein PENTCL1PPCAC_2073, partial [Pristionchus entomophagus]